MSAQVELGWNNAELTAGAKRAEGIVKHAAAQMQGAFKGVGSLDIGRLAGIGIAGVSFAQLASGIADATLRADDNKQSLLAVEGTMEGVNKRLKEMRDLARSPGLGFDQVVAADVKLRSVGLTAAESSRTIKEVGNALALVGKGKADLDGVLLAFTQIVSKGKVSAEEINQIAERVPQIRKILKDTFGTADTEALQKLGLSSEEFIRKTLDGFTKLPRAVGGLRSNWENLTDTISSSAAAIGEAVAPEALKGFNDLAGFLEKNRGSFVEAGSAAIAFGRVTGDALRGVKGAVDLVGQGWQMLITDALRLTGVTDDVSKSLDDNAAASRRLANEQAIAARTCADASRRLSELEIATKRVADSERQAAEAADQFSRSLIESAAAAAKRQIDLQAQLRAESEKTRDLTLDDTQRLEEAKQKLLDIDRQLNAVVGQKGGEEVALKLNIEREKVMQRIVTLQLKLGEEQRRANEDAKRAADDQKSRLQSAIHAAAQKSLAAVKRENAGVPGLAENAEKARSRIKGFHAQLDPRFGLSGRNGPLAPDRGPLSKGGPLTQGGGIEAFKKSQGQPSQFDRLQNQKSQFQLLQDRRGQAGDPLFNPAAANRPPDAASTATAQQTEILRRMHQLWQEALT